MVERNEEFATVGDLQRALERAIQKTLGESDPSRLATFADVGSVFLVMQNKLTPLKFRSLT